jgi:hypothetical protein
MRRLIALLLAGLIALAAAGCGDDGPAGLGGGDISGDSGDSGGDGGPDVTPPCPFTAEQVSGFVGLTMAQDAACSFRADNGFSLVTIVPASRVAGQATYDFARNLATETYGTVKDAGRGEQSYLAYKDIGGELYVIGATTSYTITLSGLPGLETNPAGYEPLLLRMFDAIPA